MEQLISQILQEYPIFTKILIGMGVLRLMFKPLMTAIQNKVKMTEDDSDDKKLHKFMTSNWYVALSFILDLTTSIKIPVKKKRKN
jgi:hypothetical protein